MEGRPRPFRRPGHGGGKRIRLCRANKTMSLYALKPKFQNTLRPFANSLAERGVTANQVTLFAAGGSIVVGALAGSACLPARCSC